jgi:hypothetical protein
MANRSDITPELCRQLLRYEPETGLLFWLFRPRELFPDDRSWKIWNTRFARKPALNSPSNGYLVGAINYVTVRAHRVAWAISHGVWPEIIDHINGDGTDNRLVNLRDVSQSENMTNLPRKSNNTSGALGVYRFGNRWAAEIKAKGEKHWLGYHNTYEEAVSARRHAATRLGFHENHDRAPT